MNTNPFYEVKTGDILNSSTKQKADIGWIPSSLSISVVMGIIAIFGPIFFHVGSSHDVDIIFIVYSLFWQFESQGGPLVFFTIFVGGFLLFIPLRIIFVGQMYRCYENCTSKKKTVVIGLIAELQTLVTLLMLPHTPYPQMRSPIPLLFLTGLLFLIAAPPRKIGLGWNG